MVLRRRRARHARTHALNPAPAPRRVLVTGSRSWTDADTVSEALYAQGRLSPQGRMLVIHGDCPTGADSHAQRFVETYAHFGVEVLRIPADWGRDCTDMCTHRPRYRNGMPYCPAAGVIRNQVLVDQGADVCLAFPLGRSPGTRDCMRRAATAGIPVLEYGEGPR